MRQYLQPIVIRIYGLDIRTEIVSENKYDVQCYRWDQTLRFGKTNEARTLGPSYLGERKYR